MGIRKAFDMHVLKYINTGEHKRQAVKGIHESTHRCLTLCPAVFINNDTQAGDTARLLNDEFQLHFDVDNCSREC
jgi:hypothetical protein